MRGSLRRRSRGLIGLWRSDCSWNLDVVTSSMIPGLSDSTLRERIGGTGRFSIFDGHSSTSERLHPDIIYRYHNNLDTHITSILGLV